MRPNDAGQGTALGRGLAVGQASQGQSAEILLDRVPDMAILDVKDPVEGATDPHLARLFERLAEMGSVLVCYSGGVDSAFVLAAAHRVLGERAVGMTAVSPSLPSFEREAAVEVAKHIGARH